MLARFGVFLGGGLVALGLPVLLGLEGWARIVAAAVIATAIIVPGSAWLKKREKPNGSVP